MGTITVELDLDYDINEQLREVIRENSNSEINTLVRNEAARLVQEELKGRVAPIVDNHILGVELEYIPGDYGYRTKATLEEMVARMVRSRLNSPSYVYDKDAKNPKDRYMTSSRGGSDTSLIQLIVADEIRKIVNEEYKPYVEECIKKYIIDKDEIADILSERVKTFFREQLRKNKE